MDTHATLGCCDTPKPIRCSQCTSEKPCTEFPVRLKNKSGHVGVCTTCRPPEPEPAPEPPANPHEVKWMCTRKRRYKTRDKALSRLVRQARGAVLQRIYECPHCKGFHLTTHATWSGAKEEAAA